ncbi:MAG TPA: hypothetical protein VFG19_08555, partial [Geobacteraceae bacterium]|nr:hypothetical protein [Geobacteraceae bacterium]
MVNSLSLQAVEFLSDLCAFARANAVFDMVVSCQEDKKFPVRFFKRLCSVHIFQGICRARTSVATFDHSDIR